MALIKYTDVITNTRGDSLPDYRVQVVTSAGGGVDLFADGSGTRFRDASGNVVNYATASSTGKVAFYWTPAEGQILQTLDAGGTLVDADADFADKFVLGNLAGEVPQDQVTGLSDALDAKADTTALDGKVATADLSSTATDKGAELTGFKQAGSGMADRTVKTRLTDFVHATDYTDVTADGTDKLTEVVAGVAADSTPFLFAPYNLKFDRAAFLSDASVPVGTVVFDLSGINDWQLSGSTVAKSFGILSKDNGPNDTHWHISSDHHAILNTNNYGTAGTASADERKATWLWSSGEFQGANQGFRGAAILQFTKESSSSRWIFNLRSVAPWNALANNHEYWTAGEAVIPGTYRVASNSQIYRTDTGGTCGATEPSHTSGTVSDGGVDWIYFDSGDRSIFMITEEGRMLMGPGTLDATFRVKTSQFDSSPSCRVEYAANGTSQPSEFRLLPTDSGGSESAEPYLRAIAGEGLIFMKSDASSQIAAFTDAGGLGVRTFRHTWAAAADGDTTPSVAGGVTTLYLPNSSATSVTALDDGVDGQIVDLVVTTANTTFVSSGTFLLDGSANITTPAIFSVIRMQKVPSNISDRWIQVGGSIK